MAGSSGWRIDRLIRSHFHRGKERAEAHQSLVFLSASDFLQQQKNSQPCCSVNPFCRQAGQVSIEARHPACCETARKDN